MTKDEIKHHLNQPGIITIRHKNARVYRVNGLIKIKVGDHWLDGLSYQRPGEEDLYCRPLEGFGNFDYVGHYPNYGRL